MKSRTLMIVLIATFVFGSLAYFIYTSTSNKFAWYQSYRFDSDEPYGTMYLQKMLAAQYSGSITINRQESLHKLLEDETKYADGNTDYVLIGQNSFFDEDDVSKLLRFVEKGNNVFIATIGEPEKLIEYAYSSDCITQFEYDSEFDSAAVANFYHPKLRKSAGYHFRFRMGAMDFPFNWQYLSPACLCNETINLRALGHQQNDKVNFLSIGYKKGTIYIHTAPIMFTNYYLTQKDKREYVAGVFAHLGGRNLIWDEVSKVPFSDMDNPYDSPLYFIMQQPALKYAWWMMLAGALLYVLFVSKRTQRVIPVLEQKTNTSLEFINAISALHYHNPNHADIAKKKMKYFLYFIRAKYGINAPVFSEEHVRRLAEKSKVPVSDIQDIYDRYKVVENYSISSDEPERLVGLYQAIEKFYKNCK